MNDQERYSLEEAQEASAKRFNGRVWELLETDARRAEEDEELILAQSASLYLWRQVGTVVQEQRGQWLFSRIYAVLERPQEALDHATKCMAITESNRAAMEDFDVAYAHEALARAHALLGNEEIANRHFQEARRRGEAIADPEDREIFMRDFRSGDWPGIE